MEKLGFVDVRNEEVLSYKSLLNVIDGGSLIKVPAGYAIQYGNVLLSLTRHAFSLSLEGRVVLEVKRSNTRISDASLLYRLGANRLVSFELPTKLCRMQHAVTPQGTVVHCGEGKLVGGLMACLIFIDRIKKETLLDSKSLSFRVPTRDQYKCYFINTISPEKDVRYTLVDANAAARVFINERTSGKAYPKPQLCREGVLQSPVVIDLDKEHIPHLSLDPLLCVSAVGLKLIGVDITEDVNTTYEMRHALPPVREVESKTKQSERDFVNALNSIHGSQDHYIVTENKKYQLGDECDGSTDGSTDC